jgi:hypothetical protein
MASRLVASTGKVFELRVIELGSRYGPPADQIDVEVVAKLDSVPDRGMGFQLRDDANRPVRQGMLDLCGMPSIPGAKHGSNTQSMKTRASTTALSSA